MTDKKDNMEIWNQVCETDPANTKDVKYGKRKFTAIAANSQFKRATELWGPYCIGWGCEILDKNYLQDSVVIHIRFWHSGDRNNSCDEVGQASLGHTDDNGVFHPDFDAVKKAKTDAVTKALSMCGFNADVFEGKFDDNKYVQERTKEAAKGKSASAGVVKAKEAYRALISDIAACEDISALDGLVLAPKTLKMIERFKVVISEWYEGDGDGEGLEAFIKRRRDYLEEVGDSESGLDEADFGIPFGKD